MGLTASAAAILALMVGLLLVVAGRRVRACRGLGAGTTVSLDAITLRSYRLGLTGRPDRLIRIGGTVIPEEWKSARTLRPWHHAQMGVYFVLIEEELGTRPPHGFVTCGDGTRHRVENDEALRAWVFDLAGRIRAARREPGEPLPVRPVPGQCRPCGMRPHCRQAKP